MKHIIDPELIVLASPNYAYGNSLGLTDEETERSTLETMDAMKKAYDKTLPMKPNGRVNSIGYLNECSGCDYKWIEKHHAFCTNCGQAIDWEVSS